MTKQVYFIRSGKRIKIGITTNLKKRIKMIGEHLPSPPEVLGVVEGTPAFEKHLHNLLGDHRLKGEWFKDHHEVRSAIKVAIEHGAAGFDFKEPESQAPFIPDPVSDENRIAAFNFAMRDMWPDDTAGEMAAFTGYSREDAMAWLEGAQMPRLVVHAFSSLMFVWLMGGTTKSYK